MSRKNDSNIIPFRNRFTFNIGMVIFILIALYVLVCVFIYIKNDPVVGYEVKEGSLSVSNIYTGIALRQEEVVSTTHAGYINYYARETEKVAAGDIIYTVDSTGKLTDLIAQESEGNNSLSEDDLKEIKADIVRFSKDFTPTKFSDVYNFKYDLQGTSSKLTNLNILSNINSLGNNLAGSGVDICRSGRSGYVVYNIDGFENLKVSDITKDCFDETKYERTQLINSTLIASGDFVYKYVTSENWSIVIPIEEERGVELEEEGYVQVKFLKSQDISWAQTELVRNDGDCYLSLTFNNSVVNYCTDRFIDIQLISSEQKGLKIPNSSIVEKEFFLVPKRFASDYNASKETYTFKKEAYMDDGTLSTQILDLMVYNETDEYYYLSTEDLDIGNYLIIDDTEEKYAVSKKDTLIGVYNINKGYADFRQITILFQNEDYSIVQSNTDYGLNCYDYIVLDADSVDENDFVYE